MSFSPSLPNFETQVPLRHETADVEEDIFHSALELESNLVAEGFSEGYQDGLLAGKQEGRDVGLKTGFETGEEVGFYRGCTEVWKSVLEKEPDAFSSRVARSIRQLDEQLAAFPLLEPQEDLQAVLESLRAKFRAISATLGVNLHYSGLRSQATNDLSF